MVATSRWTGAGSSTFDNVDEDDEWQDMPVIRSDLDADDDDRPKKSRYTAPLAKGAPDSPAQAQTVSNARGELLDMTEAAARRGEDWREKGKHAVEESDYTRLGLDDDPEEDHLHERTQYLFDDEKGMTPLSQMQATKGLLTEGQRIAYVGLCRLVMMEMAAGLRRGGHKEMQNALESMTNWMTKIMARLYRHMDVDPSEQRMIELLSEHGVTSADLVPSLIATHTVPNPNYDPDAAREVVEAEKRQEIEREQEKLKEEAERLEKEELEADIKAEEWEDSTGEGEQKSPNGRSLEVTEAPSSPAPPADPASAPPSPKTPRARPAKGKGSPPEDVPGTPRAEPPETPRIPVRTTSHQSPPTPSRSSDPPNLISPLPHTLPGVSTTLTSADATVTLDIRWTVLCDLFLAVIADSVYDARSRVLLLRTAEHLGLTVMDVVRFERRLTEALEVQESINSKEAHAEIEFRRKQDKTRRYVMMGAAAVGGGLVIGLSAGLLAPVIGAGIAAGFTTIGVTGTSGFLAGAGGAAIITTAGTVTGMNIGGKGMAKRTKAVSTFQILPLHNNKRVNVYLTMPGFMAGAADDVRLPFSVMDPAMGDVLSVLWEPEMMGETGNILRILTNEVLTQLGQQVLQATVLTALMSALQWPIMLTKLGYLIDNPWSNALDRARQVGAVLADVLIKRHVGVRPVSLIGFSLGARAIFYALMELAKRKAYGVVQEVYLLGATVTASNRVWRDVRGVVSGRFVNGYCTKDWILGYLYRATTGGLRTVAGLAPVDYVPDLENVDLTDILVGHMSYRVQMPLILQRLGFRVTADHFDEPDELLEAQEAEEDQVEQASKAVGELEDRKRKAWKLFTGSGRKTPKSGGSSVKGRVSSDVTPSKGEGEPAEYDEDADDEPPRLELPHPVGAASRSSSSLGPAPSSRPTSPHSGASAALPTSEAEADSSLENSVESQDGGGPDTFDIAAIKAEIAHLHADANAARRPSPSPSYSSSRVSADRGDGNDDLRRKWLGRPDPTPPPGSPPDDDDGDDGFGGWGSTALPTPTTEDTPPTPVNASIQSWSAPAPSWSDPSPPLPSSSASRSSSTNNGYSRPGLGPSPFAFGRPPQRQSSQISFGGANGELDDDEFPEPGKSGTAVVDDEDDGGWAPMETGLGTTAWGSKARTGSSTSSWRDDPWKS